MSRVGHPAAPLRSPEPRARAFWKGLSVCACGFQEGCIATLSGVNAVCFGARGPSCTMIPPPPPLRRHPLTSLIAGAWYPPNYATSRCPHQSSLYNVGRTMFEVSGVGTKEEGWEGAAGLAASHQPFERCAQELNSYPIRSACRGHPKCCMGLRGAGCFVADCGLCVQ